MFITDLYDIPYAVTLHSLHSNTLFCANVCCTVCNWVFLILCFVPQVSKKLGKQNEVKVCHEQDKY